MVNKTELDKEQEGIAKRWRARWALGHNKKKKKRGRKCIQLVSISVIEKRQSFQSGHKNSKNLFVLNISRERVVSNKVIHGDERKRLFVSIGPRNRPVSGGIGIVVGHGGVCHSRP